MNRNKEEYYGSFNKFKDKDFNFIIQERDYGKKLYEKEVQKGAYKRARYKSTNCTE